MTHIGKKDYSTNPEIRYEISFGKWVVIAPARSSRKKKEKKNIRESISLDKCPFEDPQKSGNGAPHFWYPQNKPLKNWEIQVFENKYPAVTRDDKLCNVDEFNNKIYKKVQGHGYHDLLITRNHNHNFSDLKLLLATEVLVSFAKRYREVAKDKCVKYVSIFQNWGKSAGASVLHPHYQIITLPIIPTSMLSLLNISKKYYTKNKKCVHCSVIENEKRQGVRVIYENKGAVAFVPFASPEPYQVNVFPKKHNAYFEDSDKTMLKYVADALQKTLKLIKNNINDPDYNFFIHTSPVYNKKSYKNYHWHIEIVPKTNIDAGFELSTGVEINPIIPEIAAKEIKNK